MISVFIAFFGISAIFDDIRVSAIICDVGALGYTYSQTGCDSCQTITTTLGVSTKVLSCVTTTCLASTTPYSQISCCWTDYCSSTKPSTTPSTAGLKCYSDLAGKSSSTASGCTYCQLTSTTYSGSTSNVQLCSFSTSCSASSSQVSVTTKTTCCSTNLCNTVSTSGTGTSGSDLVCYSDFLGQSKSTLSGCKYCEFITTTYTGATSSYVQNCASSCTPSDTQLAGITSKTTCCTTNYCNTATGAGSGGGLTCYNDPLGKKSSTKSGCTYCETDYTGAYGVSVIVQSCTTHCTPLDSTYGGVGLRTTCCQTNLCNNRSSMTSLSFELLVGWLLLVLITGHLG